MRSAVICLLAVSVVVGFSSVGCSHRSKKRKKEPLRITTTSLPDATEGVSYGATIKATGGTTPYTWSVSGLPSGLTWSQVGNQVEVSGTPAFGTAGTYSVNVTVTDSSSPAQNASTTLRLVVNSGGGGGTLKADFEANTTQGNPPLTVTFTDKSTGNPTSWEWDFDNDGTVDSTKQNPTHTYNAPGWYTVKLTVSDGTNSDTCVKERYVLVAGNIWYVNGNGGDDANSGGSWSDAFATIGKALDVAADYDLVLVADATYNERNLDFLGKKIYLKGVDHNTAGQQPVVDCQGIGGAFYFQSGETKESVCENITVKNGSADYGGAIYCCGSSPSIVNCVFNENNASSCGGAIYCRDHSSASIANCTFSNNEAYYGGAIYCCSSSPSIVNCVLNENDASGWGGAIYCRDHSSASIANCTFSGNSADRGGAIECHSTSMTMTNCILSGNSADYDGGAVYCSSSTATITNCTFSGNSARDNGGAIECYSSSMTMTNCILGGNSAGWWGGAICCDSSSPTLTNCSFGNNNGGYGGAIYCYSGSPILNNCILWGDSAGSGDEIYADNGCRATLNYCCVDNTGYGFASGVPTATIDDSNNCIYDNPQFVDAANGDYHLKDTSPCIDAGDNSLVPSGVTTDLDGRQRIVDGNNDGTATVDIGAFEYQP
ncbi:MAG: hypothetical protein DRP63_00415 [Planctomycetota bacterium]|nr:MAG: hypothetical protein DRP63_00415 [Planctomycetota bacterium]